MEKLKKSELNRVMAPKGFKFRMIPPEKDGARYAYCRLYDKSHPGTYVGQITLEPYPKNKYITHSRLDSIYHGKGLGAVLYARAIQWCLDNGYKVGSSYSPSYLAQRVWTGSSLRRFFSIKKSAYCHWEVLKQKKKLAPKLVAKKPEKKIVKKAVKKIKPKARRRAR